MKAPGATATAAAEQVESVAAAARDAFEAAAVDAVASAAGDALQRPGTRRLAAAKASAAEAAQAEELVFAVPMARFSTCAARAFSRRDPPGGRRVADEFDVAEGSQRSPSVGGEEPQRACSYCGPVTTTRRARPSQRSGHHTPISISEGDAAAPRQVLVLFAEGDLAVWDLPRSPPWSVAGPHGVARLGWAGACVDSGICALWTAHDHGSVRLPAVTSRGAMRVRPSCLRSAPLTLHVKLPCVRHLPKRERLVLRAVDPPDLPQPTRAAEASRAPRVWRTRVWQGAVAAPPLLPPLPHLSVAILSSLLHAKTLPTRAARG